MSCKSKLWPWRRVSGQEPATPPAIPALDEVLASARTQDGESLLALSLERPLLVVFLRHFGCTFCRQTLADLEQQREAVEACGARLVLVHMGSEAGARPFLGRFRLDDVDAVSDPEQELYRAFGLGRGSALQLFGPKVLWRGVRAGMGEGHGVARPEQDSFQMPGAFVLRGGVVVRAFVHESASDRPDYVALVRDALDAAS